MSILCIILGSCFSLGYTGSILVGLLFHGAVLMDSHPTDKSEDTLESGHQVRTWFSDSRCFAFLCGNYVTTHGNLQEWEKQWQRGKVIDALACYCLGKNAMSTQGRMTFFFGLIWKLYSVKSSCIISERFNLVKPRLFTIGFFGYKP